MEEPEDQEREAMGLTEERWQLTGNEAEESRKGEELIYRCGFLEKALITQDCSAERH